MKTYRWEIQRKRHGLWSHQTILGDRRPPVDPELPADEPKKTS